MKYLKLSFEIQGRSIVVYNYRGRLLTTLKIF